MKRRTFIKNAAIGSASITSGVGIFFPKPVSSYTSINYLLSRDGSSNAVFNNFILANIARDITINLSERLEPAVIQAVSKAQENLKINNYSKNITPYSLRLGNKNNPLWGKQKNEKLGPNPGFGTVQIIENIVSSITFTGSTTAGIDRAIKVLAADEKLTPIQLDSALLPVREEFEDWGTWEGEMNPKTGKLISRSSLTSYETRYGSVVRRYEVIKPGPGGFGIIDLFVDGGRFVQAKLTVKVIYK